MKFPDMTDPPTQQRTTWFLLAVVMLFHVVATAQERPAYTIFSSKGKNIGYSSMFKDLARSEVIFFGELHNNPIAHWLELEVAKSLHQNNPKLVVAMEMFEADDQIILDEYMSGTIEEKHLLSEAKIWDNYKTDYKPLVDFAKSNGLKVIASNIPRRYANLVYRKGITALDSLAAEAKAWISPLPIQVDLELSGYKNITTLMHGHGSGSTENLIMSQAIKDATMAHFIVNNKTIDNVIFHINGAYHSQDGEGILWYIHRLSPETRMTAIHVAEQTEIDKLDSQNIGKADFIICIPENMTKTF